MAGAKQPDGKNSLVGEFLLALARSPENVQEAVILFGLKQLLPFSSTLIEPYPMLSHMLAIMDRAQEGNDSGSGKKS